MKKSNKAFSLIEIMISAIILSIAVFWVFKLIWENTKIINNSDNYKTASSLFIPFQECIENIMWNNNSTWDDFYLDLNSCSTLPTQTWITINNIDYILHWKATNLASDPINYTLNISTDTIKIEHYYKVSNN